MADSKSMEGLNVHDILSIVADTKLEILKLDADGTTNRVSIKLNIPNEDEAKKEAKILAYMLYKETIQN